MIDIKDFSKACWSSPEAQEKMRKEHSLGWLIVPFAKYANEMDDYSESLINDVMCTETCPCFRQPEPIYEMIKGKSQRMDAYGAYLTLPSMYLEQYGRVFHKKDAIGNGNETPNPAAPAILPAIKLATPVESCSWEVVALLDLF